MNTTGIEQPRASLASGKGVQVEKTITVNLPVQSVYAFWRRFENLPRFMRHLESVTELDEKRSHWIVRSPRGKLVQWDAELIADHENEMISWRSLPGSDVDNAGSVWFTPAAGQRGTVIRVVLRYSPPAGKLGAFIARLLGKDAEAEIAEDLFRLKSLLETGEVPTTSGQPMGGKTRARQ